ncbi:MAG: hypothetical protein ABI867_30665 [Kofleriaceae bacterium]
MRWLLVMVVVVASAPGEAEACTCGTFERPSVETCSAASRVFAGTIGAYRWPVMLGARVEVELEVDRVWRGDVATRVIARTGAGHAGSCGLTPLPGTRFVVCDDEAGDAAPGFSLCEKPAFAAPELEAALGPSAPASRMPSVRQRVHRLWTEPLALPVLALALAALLGRLVRRQPSSLRPLFVVAIIGGGVAAVIAMRVLLFTGVAALGAVTIATLLGLVLGFESQRRPFVLGNAGASIVVALGAVVVVVTLGYWPVQVPWDRPDAVACSRARAQAFLATGEKIRRAPRSCSRWGTGTYDVAGECLGVPDGTGGEWWTCRSDAGSYTLYTGAR